jgi:hypothetical protein
MHALLMIKMHYFLCTLTAIQQYFSRFVCFELKDTVMLL